MKSVKVLSYVTVKYECLKVKQWKGNVQWDWCQVRSSMNENMPMQGFEAIKDG